MENLEYIRSRLPKAALWGQLAEECAELAQAALKMQRLEQGYNLPRKSREECIQTVIEEHADVAFLFKLLEWNDKEERKPIEKMKTERWAKILQAEEANQEEQEKQAFENGREFGRWEAEQEMQTGHWQLFVHESYQEIGCSCCGYSPWKCTTLYPECDMIGAKELEKIKQERKFCQQCGAHMADPEEQEEET